MSCPFYKLLNTKKKKCSNCTVVYWVQERNRTNVSSHDVQEYRGGKDGGTGHQKHSNVVLAKVGGLQDQEIQMNSLL